MKHLFSAAILFLNIAANAQTVCLGDDYTYRKAATKADDSLFQLVKTHVETTAKPSLDTLLYYIEISAYTGHYAETARAYELADSLHPPQAKIKKAMGQIYLNNNEIAKAYQYFKSAYELNATDLQGNHQLAQLELQFADTAAAIDILKKAAPLYSECNHDYYFLADIYRQARQYDSAIKYYSVYTGAVSDKDPHMWRGLCYMELKDYTRAMTDFEHDMKLSPTNAYAFYYAGVAQFRQDYSIIAISYFERATQFWGIGADAYYMMGMCYEKLERRRKAEKCYEHALKANPKHADAALRLKLLKHKK